MLLLALALAAATDTPKGELPVEPYQQSNANAGAAPFAGSAMLAAFHGRAGIDRVVEGFVARNVADPRIAEIFMGQDLVRLRRLLKEQFCFLLNGGCDYSGRDMHEAHKNLGTQVADFNAIVENLQAAMQEEGVAWSAQNRFLAKLAPMERRTVAR